MQNYRKGSHTVYDCKYHIVWITKYRKQVMVGPIAEAVRTYIKQICQENDVQIIKGHVSKDHIHMFVSVPPNISISALVQAMKGKSSRKLLQNFKALQKQFWGQHFWARGYFVCSSGNITDEVIMNYIENQDLNEPEGGDFKIDGETTKNKTDE